ncbi:MAG: carboxylating nicotinate-nucleotide diphosphorylase [Aphanocapsa feldmannii 288cV]|nr:MAG: carboxylating nicotinate-nucleotide diphosphorylase [Aphanocapsa feldmannii 288cV]
MHQPPQQPAAAAALLGHPGLRPRLRAWLEEDMGRGDRTAAALSGRRGRAHWLAKQDGVFCGGVLLAPLFQQLDPTLAIHCLVADGMAVRSGERLVILEGSATALLAGERTSLNLAMRLSGIATTTRALVAELEGSGIALADTRKTTPGLRDLEKYAVRCGGGINHRMGLDDAAMLKENHLAWAGGLEQAMVAIRANGPWTSAVVVEAETAAEALAAARAGADGVLLDEFSVEALQTLVPRLRALRPGIRVELSGIQPDRLRAYAASGVDLISTSAPITRGPWLDLSMRFT